MFLIKLKLFAALLGTAVPSGRHVAYRAAADSYAVVGEGFVRTVSCTQNAVGMDVEVSRADRLGRRWITFIDRDGEREAQCQVDDRPRLPTPTEARVLIRRSVAVTE